MTYVVDLDGTLCFTQGRKYAEARPYPLRIKRINALMQAGHRVIIDTARGSGTGKDYYALTVKQLDEWGVTYSALYVGSKTPGDVYIDDKAQSARRFFAHAHA